MGRLIARMTDRPIKKATVTKKKTKASTVSCVRVKRLTRARSRASSVGEAAS
jgi:hypothetical protein